MSDIEIERRLAVVKILATEARPLILQNFRPDSCIVSTAVACDVLAYADIPATRCEVLMIAANHAAIPCIANNVPLADWPDEAWSVGVVPGQGDSREAAWPGGHLVAIATIHPDLRLLIDLSADQANRPLRGMPILEPVVAPWDGSKTAVSNDTTVVMYRRAGRPSRIAHAPDWVDRTRRQPIVDTLIDRLHDEGLV